MRGDSRAPLLTPTCSRADNGLDNWLCCTLVVAAEGKLVLPKINSLSDMRKALTTLGSVSPDTLLAFELLWTPQVRLRPCLRYFVYK